MSVPDKVLELVEIFNRNQEAYLSGVYSEAQVRLEFIDPFFRALDWDMYNEKGYAEAYKDVIPEDAIKVGGATKAPDYCFRIGGARKFFVEAKKPSVDLKDDISPAYQLRRYAWSGKLPLSILTDFEEFAVYDCRIKPVKTDTAATARTLYIPYTDYEKRWDDIASIFSRDEVLKGSFDKYAESTKRKRGTAEVDDVFLEEIESWRDMLARNIALRNPGLTTRELNYAVQRTIDRIIFLRICEDRGIEDYGKLMALQNGVNVYQRLCDLFVKADERYNSGLFHFRHEKERPEAPDELSLGLAIDDKVLKEIIKRLYYPDSPYEFSVLPANILGQVYEQFLGKVIRLTPKHRAVVEDKPEVKKAGGVYYTPTYIVDYIVGNTVGELLEGKNPKQASKLRILDPACGSGSFLIGAYQYLLDWHRDWYTDNDPEKWAKGRNPRIYAGPGGDWRLTTGERKRILLNTIYGVDIDSQAVEVTKLSLLLKVLEGENEQTLAKQLQLFQERALPDLSENIKCGNSLIGPDFYEDQQMSFLDEENRYRINVFDWDAEFPEVMNGGGFDTVIGNPPYGAWFKVPEAAYFGKHYQVYSGVKDVYAFFIEQGLNILEGAGILSFIVPSAWLGGPQYASLRSLLLRNEIDILVLLPFDIFSSAYIDTVVVAVSKKNPAKNHNVRTYVFGKRHKLTTIQIGDSQYMRVEQTDWMNSKDQKFVLNPNAIKLLCHLESKCDLTLGDIAKMKRGVLFDKKLLTNNKLSDLSHRYFEGDVYRYEIKVVAEKWVEFDDKMKERPKEFLWFESNRILMRRLVNRQQRLMSTLTDETFITNKNLYTIKSHDDRYDLRILLGLLNSSLLSFLYLSQVTQAVKDDFPQVTIRDLLSLPIPLMSAIDENGSRVAERVERFLDLQRQLGKAKTPDDKTAIQRQIDATDRQIDNLVYNLYGLTEEEIKIVEEATE